MERHQTRELKGRLLKCTSAPIASTAPPAWPHKAGASASEHVRPCSVRLCTHCAVRVLGAPWSRRCAGSSGAEPSRRRRRRPPRRDPRPCRRRNLPRSPRRSPRARAAGCRRLASPSPPTSAPVKQRHTRLMTHGQCILLSSWRCRVWARDGCSRHPLSGSKLKRSRHSSCRHVLSDGTSIAQCHMQHVTIGCTARARADQLANAQACSTS